MSLFNLKEGFRINERLVAVINRLLLVGMMVCVSISIMQLLQRLTPGSRLGYLPLIGLLMSLEAVLSQAHTRRGMDLEMSVGLYRVAEWVVMLVILKVLVSVWTGLERLLQAIPAWSTGFLESFFTYEYAVAIATAVVIWGLTTWYLADFLEISGDEALIDAAELGGYMSNRGGVREAMINRFMVIGFVMVVVLGIVSVDFAALMHGRLVGKSTSGLNIVFYFMFGLLLLSQMHFAVLRAGWAWERIPIDKEMAKRWIGYSLVSLLAVSLVAYLLPTSYSIGLLAVVRYLVSILMMALYAIFFILLTPFIWLLVQIGKLLKFKYIPIEQLPPPELPKPPPAVESGGPDAWLKFLQSLAFWVIFVLVIGYAFYLYLRQNKELTARLRQSRAFRFLVKAWDWLSGRLRGFNQVVAAVVSAGVGRLRAIFRPEQNETPWTFFNPRKLPPRQRVQFYYLAMVRRSGENGVPRRIYQTPKEYALALKKELPETDESLAEITQDFIEARYTRHEISVQQVDRVKKAWEAIRRALQERAKRMK